MSWNVILLVVASAALVVGAAGFASGAVTIWRTVAAGRPMPGRFTPLWPRIARTVAELLTHRRFAGRPAVKVAHWFVMVSFPVLALTLGQALVQIARPSFVLPLIGHWPPWGWLVELLAWGGLLGILYLTGLRLATTTPERSSRFFGSTRWQAWFVEGVIALVLLCVLVLRVLDNALLRHTDPELAGALHFPLTAWLVPLTGGATAGALEDAIVVVALVKILVSAAWLWVVGRSPAMGVAWHRFLGVVNVLTSREVDGSPALGPARPLLLDGKELDLDGFDEADEDARLGLGTAADLTWKGMLDLTSCTECGRCQEQCPAWATGKPLSPKLLTIALRDHAMAAAPFARAAARLADDDGAAAAGGTSPGGEVTSGTSTAVGTRPSEPGPGVGPGLSTPVHTGDVLGALLASGAAPGGGASGVPTDIVGGVIDPDVLWACTMCGACVEQCPVDIEHVDTILDLRRHEALMASAFPKELGGMLRKLESRGNPWGQPARRRMDWTKGLEVEVPVLGEDVESLDDVDYLFWVGCAGAFDERARGTSRAIVELLDIAGVSFAVLGQGETCTGDPARRAGNELLFQMLAAQNVETLNEAGARAVVVSCAHCFNTLAKEYPSIGGSYEVVHHSQLLGRLVREGRLTLAPPEDGVLEKVTFHDPCFLGRHNKIYSPPRELVGSVPGLDLVEMPANRSTAMCCGGGGARAFMEETTGARIADVRAEQALATGATTIATACPFCTTMLGSSGPVAQAGARAADEELRQTATSAIASTPGIRVTDIAQLMLASARRGAAGTGGSGPGEGPAS